MAQSASASRRDRRDELLSAAIELGRRSGLGSIEAAAVAVRAGVSKALVYYYFPTHRDLQAAVVRASADELLAAIRDAVVLPANDDPAGQLTRGLDAAISFIEEQPEAFAALSRSAGFHPKLFEVFEDARNGIADLLAEGIGLTEVTPGQRIALRSWIAMTEEAVLHWVLADKPVPRADLVAFCQAGALQMLATPLAQGTRAH
jgi:AcrR family transcriptional regulator